MSSNRAQRWVNCPTSASTTDPTNIEPTIRSKEGINNQKLILFNLGKCHIRSTNH